MCIILYYLFYIKFLYMNYKKNAFTLIELIVWIAIIGILSLWIKNLYWNSIPDKQKLNLFTTKLVWIINTVKNYSLVWKWIWTTLETPIYFKMKISKSWSGSLETYYNTWATDFLYEPLSITNFDQYYSIQSIQCKSLDLIASWSISNVDISFEWSNITLSWCIDNYHKIIDINLLYKGFKKIIRLNGISWVVEEITN